MLHTARCAVVRYENADARTAGERPSWYRRNQRKPIVVCRFTISVLMSAQDRLPRTLASVAEMTTHMPRSVQSPTAAIAIPKEVPNVGSEVCPSGCTCCLEMRNREAWLMR